MTRRLIPIEEFIGNYSILLDIDEVKDWGRESRFFPCQKREFFQKRRIQRAKRRDRSHMLLETGLRLRTFQVFNVLEGS